PLHDRTLLTLIADDSYTSHSRTHLYALVIFLFFFFNDTATTEIYTLSLHDALPISSSRKKASNPSACRAGSAAWPAVLSASPTRDRKSTRLNSSHVAISYAVFCLKKKKDQRHSHTVSLHAPNAYCVLSYDRALHVSA